MPAYHRSTHVIRDPSVWSFVHAVTRPVLALASFDFLSQISARLSDAGIQYAVANHDSGPVVDWMLGLVALQGVSDAAAFAFDAKNGGVRTADLARGLRGPPVCSRLQSYWSFDGCSYRKGVRACAAPDLLDQCVLPTLPLRKGGLNVAAFGLFLFIQDVCDGDLIGWIDATVAAADPGRGSPDRGEIMAAALVSALSHIPNTGAKIWSMILAELLLAGDPGRDRWVTAGASMIAVDTLVHAFLHRTGILRRLDVEHRYGAACYAPNGCAEVIGVLASQIDARQINSDFPACFPRLLQHAIWQFCATGVRDICNGVRIASGSPCQQTTCPVFTACERHPL